jgi:uncharacterized membrane protein YhaH (DUF805 family)
MDYFWLLFGFRGRLNRARYLILELAVLASWLMLWVRHPAEASPQWEALHWLAAIFIGWINLAAIARRLHDRNRSGWWTVAVFIVNRLVFVFYGLFFGSYFGADISNAEQLLLVLAFAVLSIVQTWIFIELFFMIGTDGTNRFGPDPTRTVFNISNGARPAPAGVPDFLVRQAGPLPRR